MVVAAPPDVTADVVARALADYPESVVVDIASVKADILAELRGRGADLSRYVGTPPHGRPGEVRARCGPRRAVHLHAVGGVPVARSPRPKPLRRRVPWPRTWAPSSPSSRPTNTMKPWRWCRTCPR